MVRALVFVFLALVAVSSAQSLPGLPVPNVVRYFFNATQVTAAPDGFQRTCLGVLGPNSQPNGPLIEATTGDIISVTLFNDLPEVTSIHFHGFFAINNSFYDGVPSVTQCPIPPGASFEYRVTTAGQYGTFWWHSHSHGQYIDGMRGPVVIHANPEPQATLYDYEYVIALTDWYHQQSSTVINHYLQGLSLGAEPVAPAILINGVGNYNCKGIGILPGITCSTPNTVPEYKFRPGKRYRLRIINMSAFAALTFSIDNHNLTIIEADGEDISPYMVSSLGINIAQRYSVIVTANQPNGTYAMRVQMLCGHRFFILNVQAQATVNYTSELPPFVTPASTTTNPSKILAMTTSSSDNLPSTSDTSTKQTCEMLDTLNLTNLVAAPAPGNASWFTNNNITDLQSQRATLTNALPDSVTFTINFNMSNSFYNKPVPFVNGINYQPQQIPVLTQVAQAGPNALTTALNLPNSTNAYVIPSSATSATFVLNNFDGGEHPFHLHGHRFAILGLSATGPFNSTRDAPNLNYINPLRRDTVTVPANGWAALRFDANNPGVWFVHCHIDFHLLAGLAFMFVEHPEEITKYANQLPTISQGVCSYNLSSADGPAYDDRLAGAVGAAGSATSAGASLVAYLGAYKALAAVVVAVLAPVLLVA